MISGHPQLIQAAKDAVLQRRYQPYLLDGQAVACRFPVTLTYKLGRR